MSGAIEWSEEQLSGGCEEISKELLPSYFEIWIHFNGDIEFYTIKDDIILISLDILKEITERAESWLKHKAIYEQLQGKYGKY